MMHRRLHTDALPAVERSLLGSLLQEWFGCWWRVSKHGCVGPLLDTPSFLTFIRRVAFLVHDTLFASSYQVLLNPELRNRLHSLLILFGGLIHILVLRSFLCSSDSVQNHLSHCLQSLNRLFLHYMACFASESLVEGESSSRLLFIESEEPYLKCCEYSHSMRLLYCI